MDNIVNMVVSGDGDERTAEITLPDGWCVAVCENHTSGVTMKFRKIKLPKVGSRLTINGMLVKVNAIEFDSEGRISIIGDDGNKHPWV